MGLVVVFILSIIMIPNIHWESGWLLITQQSSESERAGIRFPEHPQISTLLIFKTVYDD